MNNFIPLQMRYGSMKVTQMPPVHASNLVANSGNTAYGVDVINRQPLRSHYVNKWWSSLLMFICISWPQIVNSLVPGKFELNFRYLIFQIISVIDGWGISCELALRWMSLNFTDYKSTLVQVMDWCRQATSHYLSQCWPRSLSPYGITRPQWGKGYSSERQQVIFRATLILSYVELLICILWLTLWGPDGYQAHMFQGT